MKTVSIVLGLMISVGLAGGCAEATRPCGGDGTTVQAGGGDYCVYRASIVIVGGFECPASMPFRMDFDTATVCGNRGFDDLDVPQDICERAFVPCTDDPSDAGPIAQCDAGRGDCDQDPRNGCETALTTLSNCGACGVPCQGLSMTCSTGVCRTDTLR